MLCIICMTMKPRRTRGGEHVIPYALGGSFTIDRVCLDCDNRLGNVADAGLINISAIEQRRSELKLAGHNGVVPDPEAKLRKVPLVSQADPKHRIREVIDADTGETTMQTVSTVEFKVTRMDDGTLIEPGHIYIDPADRDKAEMLAASALKKARIRDEELVKRLSAEFAANLETVEGFAVFSKRVEIKTGGHQNGFLKIAYEFAWYWLGDSWLYSPDAIAMREMLAGKEPSTPIRGKIYDDPNLGVVAIGGDPRVVHVAYVYQFEGQLLVMMRIFDLFTVGFAVAAEAHQYHVPYLNAIVMQNVERRYELTHFGVEPGAHVWTNTRFG